ncbi:MAG: hypothetical protein ACR2PX_23860 [Endozoicomonas sp.]|uniref:hypothetical protein n=1 Tax=Endozoicomonas sp. TaxID=1892382 RepID=UPI003D9BFD9B
MKEEIAFAWNTFQPELEGLYFVAVQFGQNAGTFDFIEWKDGSWHGIEDEYVIAHIDIQSFKKQLSIKWPGESTPPLRAPRSEVGDSDLWEEV